jgi:hypothetical protein
MHEHEIARLAAAVNVLRPDWPVKQLTTLLAGPMAQRSRRDAAVALAWIACDASTASPYRVLEAGPWWKAVAVDGQTVSLTPYDHGTACGICDQAESRCKANPHAEHEYEPKPHVIAERVPGQHAADIVLGLRDRVAKAQHIEDNPSTDADQGADEQQEASA